MTSKPDSRPRCTGPRRPGPLLDELGLLALLAASVSLCACGEATTKFSGARASYTVDGSARPNFRDKNLKFSQSSFAGDKYTIKFGANDFVLGLPTLEEKTYRSGDDVLIEHTGSPDFQDPGGSNNAITYRIDDCSDSNFRVDVHRDYDLVWGTFRARLCDFVQSSSTVDISEGTFAAEFVE